MSPPKVAHRIVGDRLIQKMCQNEVLAPDSIPLRATPGQFGSEHIENGVIRRGPSPPPTGWSRRRRPLAGPPTPTDVHI